MLHRFDRHELWMRQAFVSTSLHSSVLWQRQMATGMLDAFATAILAAISNFREGNRKIMKQRFDGTSRRLELNEMCPISDYMLSDEKRDGVLAVPDTKEHVLATSTSRTGSLAWSRVGRFFRV